MILCNWQIIDCVSGPWSWPRPVNKLWVVLSTYITVAYATATSWLLVPFALISNCGICSLYFRVSVRLLCDCSITLLLQVSGDGGKLCFVRHYSASSNCFKVLTYVCMNIAVCCSAWLCQLGNRKVIHPVKLSVDMLLTVIWLELSTSWSSSCHHHLRHRCNKI